MIQRISFDKLNAGEVFPVLHRLFEQCFVCAAEVSIDLIRNHSVVPDSIFLGRGCSCDSMVSYLWNIHWWLHRYFMFGSQWRNVWLVIWISMFFSFLQRLWFHITIRRWLRGSHQFMSKPCDSCFVVIFVFGSGSLLTAVSLFLLGVWVSVEYLDVVKVSTVSTWIWEDVWQCRS